MLQAALTVNAACNLPDAQLISKPFSAKFLSQNSKIKIHEIINFAAVFDWPET
jgi:hypothetical protein